MLREFIKRLEAWAQDDFLADSERDSDRNGYLSFRAEWHAATWGLSAGLLAILTGQMVILVGIVGWLFTRAGDTKVPEYIPYPKHFKKESAYLLGHMVAGILLGILLRAVLVFMGIQPPALDPSSLLSLL